MCIVLYLGSEERLPIIPYELERPAFNTRELDAQEKPVLQQFSMPYVLYIGSNEGCGCSFRHALFVQGNWSYVAWEEGEDADATQEDHNALVEYLKASNQKRFELYVCWDGDYAFTANHDETIRVEEILHPDFFFKERGHYWITIGS